VLAERDTREPIEFSNYGRCSFDARTIEANRATFPESETSELGRIIYIVSAVPGLGTSRVLGIPILLPREGKRMSKLGRIIYSLCDVRA